jgi:curli production assembly/transport component CsgG
MSKHLTLLFGRNLQERRSKFAVEIGAGATLIDIIAILLRPLGRTALKYFSLQVLALVVRSTYLN